MDTEIIFKKENLAQEAGLYLNKVLSENTDKQILLMLSGGSSLAMLEYVNEEILGKNITITILDERHTKDIKISNFSKLLETNFYHKASRKGASFIDTRVEGKEHIEETAHHFEESIRLWKMNNPQGKIIATMGIGEDGHTAGIMPYPKYKEAFDDLFENIDKWIIGYNASGKSKHPMRITTTNTFLRSLVSEAIMYVSGENKKEALEKTLSEKGTLNETPARIIHKMKKVTIFTDIEIHRLTQEQSD